MINKTLVENQFGHGGIKHSRLHHWFKRKMRPTLGRAEIPFDWTKPIPDPMYPVKNQGTSFSCGGQAGSYLIRDLLKTAGKDQGEISAKSIYAPYCAVGGGMTLDAIETCIGAHGSNLESLVSSYDVNGNPLTEPMFELDIVRLRRAIQGILPGNIIKMKCYNKPEMEMIRDQLTPEERKLVIFTWIDWPQENHAD